MFYTFAMRGLMGGSSDIIKTINRDELSHVRLYQKLLPEAKVALIGNDSLDSLIYELTDTAVQQEIKWTGHIMRNDVLGITEDSTEKYTKYLANIRLKAIGLEALYPGMDKSPYRHLENIADTGSDAGTKGNFFEIGITAYNMSSAVGGWDEF